MRLVIPAEFIRLPARMKNGTASSGKLSTPPTIRWITVSGGMLPDIQMYASAASAIAIAIGKPVAIAARNPPNRTLFIAGPSRAGLVLAGALQHAPPLHPMAPRHLHRAPCRD